LVYSRVLARLRFVGSFRVFAGFLIVAGLLLVVILATPRMIAARTLCGHASYWLSRPDSRVDDSEPEDDHHQGDDHESDDEEYRMIMNQMVVSHRHSKRKATENAPIGSVADRSA
jgi:hypothetical protein